MRAFITRPDKSVAEIEGSLDVILEAGSKPGHKLFIPACLCGSSHACPQHPKFARRID